MTSDWKIVLLRVVQITGNDAVVACADMSEHLLGEIRGKHENLS
jgi:hypothetical protein